MDIFKILTTIHIVCGALALLSFPLPLLLKKGGSGHRLSGWVYVVAMGGVCITTIAIGRWRLFFDPLATADTISFALFLMMIAVFSGSAVWSGLRVLTFKKRMERHLEWVDLSIIALRILYGAILCAYGFFIDNNLLAWFSLIPVGSGIHDLFYWLRPTQHKMHWWFHHMESMFTACIATVTAFVVTAVPRIYGGSNFSLALWLAPTFILIPIQKGFEFYYKKKFQL